MPSNKGKNSDAKQASFTNLDDEYLRQKRQDKARYLAVRNQKVKAYYRKGHKQEHNKAPALMDLEEFIEARGLVDEGGDDEDGEDNK